MNRFAIAVLPISLIVAACQSGDASETVPGDSDDTRPYAGIADDAVVMLTGTEPFWGATVNEGSLTWSTPENIDGVTVPVERFAGRGGVSFSGEIGGAALDIAVTPGECSDGMSDRIYPFTATVQIGREQRNGCAWIEDQDLGEP